MTWRRRVVAFELPAAVMVLVILGAGLMSFAGHTIPAGATWPHTVSSAAPNPAGPGYWDVYSDGTVTAIGGVNSYGSMAGQQLNSPIIGITPTPNGCRLLAAR